MTAHILHFFYVFILSLLLAGISAIAAQSQTGETIASPTDAAMSSEGTFAKGLLWKIAIAESSSSTASPDYLFGTMHSDDPRIATVPESVQQALSTSDSFCMEMIPDLTSMLTMSKSMLSGDGTTLQSVIGDALFEQLSPLMLKRGIPSQALSMLKPWAVFLILSVPPQKTGMFLDLVLYESAKQHNKALCGLETAEEQITIFEKTSLEDQILLLQQIAKDPPAQEKQLEQLTEKYLARDIRGLLALSQEFNDATPSEQKSTEAFLRRLIDDRNRQMVERMLPRLKEGTAFIAVGALHLPGETGILQLLVNRGYTVSVVY